MKTRNSVTLMAKQMGNLEYISRNTTTSQGSVSAISSSARAQQSITVEKDGGFNNRTDVASALI